MGRTLLTGATGTLGQALLPRLTGTGYTIRAASRSPPTGSDTEWIAVDLATGEGVEDATADVDIIVHAASAPRGDSEAVDARGTERLLEAASAAGVSNFIYVSIVGVDAIPLSYYQHKLAAERAVEASEIPTTIIRATQFHSFLDEILGKIARLPVWPLPTKLELQPVDVGEVASIIVKHTTPEASGRVPPVGGPKVQSVGEIARAYRGARGLRRPIVRIPMPGAVANGFRAGKGICPDRTVGVLSWEEWLAQRYENAATVTDRSGSKADRLL